MGDLIGFIVLTGFGIVWWLMAAGQLDGLTRVVELLIGLVIVVALVFRRFSTADRLTAGTLPDHRPDDQQERMFRNVGIAEAASILVGVIACSRFGHPEWIPVWCAFVVGVHFLPLAGIFNVEVYKLTGVAFMATAVVIAVIIPLTDGPDRAWFIATGLVSALILWVTCGYLVLVGGRGR